MNTTITATPSTRMAPRAATPGLLQILAAWLRRAFELAGAPYADGRITPM